MPDFELFQERTVSGKGMLRVPSELTKRRAVVLYSDLVRPPSSPYYNANYSPSQSLYGFLTFLRNGYVIGDAKIHYKEQSWDAVPDITAQNLIAIKCMYKGILQSFVNFAVGLQIPVIEVTDLIKDYEYLDLMWDEVRVVCYADTALKLRLYALSNDKCQDDADKPKKPQKPPPPPPPVPPGTPVQVDPPYDDNEDNPDDVTEPYPGDTDSPFPIGEQCQEFDVTVNIFPIVGDAFPFTCRVFGEIEGVGLGGNGSYIYILCRGGRDSLTTPPSQCLDSVQEIPVFGSSEPTYSDVVFVSAVEV